MDLRAPRRRSGPSPAPVLFAAMFASQASLLVLSPVLAAVARDLGVTTATAAQLRSVSGLVAGGLALHEGLRARPRPLRDVLAVGIGLLAAGAAGSAAAPGFAVLVAAQVVVGAGLGLTLSAALAAAGEWSEDRARTLSWALAGQPVAWIVGMPLAGLAAESGWRLAWVVVPLASSLVAGALVLARPRDVVAPPTVGEPSLLDQPGAGGWAVGELLAYGGWAGTLVFVGALFVDSYGTSTTVVGLLLALAAVAYLPGNFLARRLVDDHARRLLAVGGLVAGGGVALLGIARGSAGGSATVLAAVAFVAGARTLAGSTRGMQLAPACRMQAMSVRTASVQFGYLLGSLVGGLALRAGGYALLGVTLGGLHVAGALPHLRGGAGRRRGDRTPARPGPAGWSRQPRSWTGT